MRRNAKLSRLLALLLTVCMTLTMLPVNAMAALWDNTPEYNQEMLDYLQSIGGGEASAEAVYDALQKYGVLDEDGHVPEQWSITLDGAPITLSELRALLADPDADLTRTVTVDGAAVTLKDIGLMLEIEDYIAYLKKTYFSDDVPLTDAHRESLASLYSQLQNDGLTLYGSSADDTLIFRSGADHTQRITAPETLTIDENGGTLTLTLAHPAKSAITVSYTVAEGSVSGTVDGKTSGTLTFAEGERTVTAAVACTDYDAERWNGKQGFAISFASDGTLYSNGSGYTSTQVLVSNDFSYYLFDENGKSVDLVRVFSDFTGKGDVYDRAALISADGAEYPMYWLSQAVIQTGSKKPECDPLISSLNFYNNFDEIYMRYIQMFLYDDLFDLLTLPVEISLRLNLPPEVTAMLEDGAADGIVFDKYERKGKELDDTMKINGVTLPTLRTQAQLYPNGTGTEYVTSDAGTNLEIPMDRGETQLTVTFIIEETGGRVPLNWNVSIYRYFTFYDGIHFYNSDNDTAVSTVTVPAGTYYYGQVIPITVTFSEPVYADDLTITVNGKSVTAVDTGETSYSMKQTFLYSVEQVDSAALTITGIRGAKDLAGRTMAADTAVRRLSGVTLDTPNKADAITGVNAVITDPQTAPKLTATVSISGNEKLTDWLAADMDAGEGGKSISKSLTASIDGKEFVPLAATGDSLTGGALTASFDLPINTGEDDTAYVAELYLNGKPMIGKYAAANQAPAKFVPAGDITLTYSDDYPADATTPVYVQDNKSLSLGYTLSGSGYTWGSAEDFTWASSDETVAAIDQSGNITPTGKAGTVHFALTATNGGVAGKAVSVDSRDLKIDVGLTPFLTIPDNVSTIAIIQGKDAVVNWTSNICAKNGDTPTTFHIEVKKGGTEVIHAQDVSGTAVSSYTIPASVLTEISQGAAAAYTVTVSTTFEGKAYSATAQIHTTSQPAVISLTALPRYYITDETGSIDVAWTLEHFDSINAAEFELLITRNREDQPVYQTTSTTNSGGNYSLALRDVTDYRDVYTVTVKAKNSAESTWSYDSFVLYVYDADALELWIDGEDAGDSLTMSNVEKIADMSQSDILALKRDISLANVVSINYGDHAWGEISDQIAWASSNSGVASVNYQRGTLYENIENFNYTSYRPTTQFVLSGLSDGQTQVTAQHVLTGMNDTLDVTVNTLKNKLYLFQAYPQTAATLVYTNGDGEKKTVTSDEKGAAAIYEPSGIVGDVYFTAKMDGVTYLGTYYGANLASGEADSTKLELYPCNNIKLRQAAYSALYLKKPDGTPYQGSVTIRGGVYVNSEYCGGALFAPQGAGAVNQSGESDMTATVGADGKLVMQMDVGQWLSGAELSASDQVQYIFELRFGTTYYPQFITVNANMGQDQVVTSGDSIVALEAAARTTPFIAAQTVTYENSTAAYSVRGATDEVGPSENHPSVTLHTTVLWWGADKPAGAAANTLTLADQYSVVPGGQHSENINYPFASMLITKHDFTMDEDTTRDWINTYETRSMSLRYSADGSTVSKSEPLSFPVVNMLGAIPVIESDGVQDAISKFRASVSQDGSAAFGAMGLSDGILNEGFTMISKATEMGGEDSFFHFKLAATSNPTRYRALCSISVGDTYNTDTIEEAKDGEGDFSYLPGVFDLKDMYNGEYLKNAKDDFARYAAGTAGDRDLGGSFSGCIEGVVEYSKDFNNWVFYPTSGGFSGSFSAAYGWTYNSWVGPVPITASFSLGGSVALSANFLNAYYWGGGGSSYHSGTDVLTELRLFFYMNAFGGIGFDYSVVALKIGIFGELDIDAQFQWLNRSYLSDPGNTSSYVQHHSEAAVTDKEVLNGQHFSVMGQVGINFVAKFLFISYENTLASAQFRLLDKTTNDWVSIQNIWKYNYEQSQVPIIGGSRMLGSYSLGETQTLESRDYLAEYERTWNSRPSISPFSLDEEQKVVTALQTNAYPYANPVLTDDGQVMLYLTDAGSSDVTQTRVACSLPSTSGVYQEGSVIDEGGYGDSYVKLAGNRSFAAAAWVRQNLSIGKEAGDAVTAADQMLMMNSTEIMAAIRGSDGTWATTSLTHNATADLAPVIATNGSRAVVAWRSVSANDGENPMEFDGSDQILYRVYNGSNWSDQTYTLYNGTSGPVKGIEASMLTDGTAAILYTLDTDGVSDTVTDREIICAVVGSDNSVTRNIRLTNDAYIDENPQITTATFTDNTERFVLGWYSEQDADGVATSDVRLCALDSAGAFCAEMPDSISQVTRDVTVSSNFHFIKNADTIGDLSILWTETAGSGTVAEDGTVQADKDLLLAVKFIQRNDLISLTPAIEVAQMPDYTLIDSFDAYVSDAGTDEIKAVILGTNYNQGYEKREVTVGEAVGTALIPKSVSGLYTATECYENVLTVDSVMTDFNTILRGCAIPVQFGVVNGGVEPITQIKIDLAGQEQTYSDLNLMPGDSITLTTQYDVPADKVIDPSYTVSATYRSGDSKAVTDTLYLNIPDIGISKLDVLSEAEGQRVVQLALYNRTDAALSGSDRYVELNFYQDAAYETPISTVKIDTNDALAMLDEGGYTTQVTIPLSELGVDGSEIPETGVTLYAKACVMSKDSSDGEYYEMNEYNSLDNYASTKFYSLLDRTGEPVTVTSILNASDEGTTVDVQVRNNSLTQKFSGNLIVSLLDAHGNVLDTQQTYSADAPDNGLLSLSGEQAVSRSFTFGQTGAQIVTQYSDVVVDQPVAAPTLASLSCTGVAVALSDFVESETEENTYTATIETKNLTATVVSVGASNPADTVAINAQPGLSATVPLRNGGNQLTITVQNSGGTTATYLLTIQNEVDPSPSTGGSGSSNRPSASVSGTGGKVTTGNGTVTIVPDEGYQIKSVTVNGEAVDIPEDGKLTGLKATDKVVVTFEKIPEAADVLAHFTDLQADAWYYEAIQYAVENGLFFGTSDTTFSPDGATTRGMIVTVLYRLAGQPSIEDEIWGYPYADVDSEAYYGTAVYWARLNGVASGYDNERFGPNDTITREQLATMLYRYAGSPAVPNLLLDFTDAGQLSDYAQDAMRWAVSEGIVTGKGNGILDPKGNATRAQVAAMLMRYCESLAK